MLVYLHQYREDDANETVRSGSEVAPEIDEEEYFDVDDLTLDEWERVERGDRILQRRTLDYEDVTAVSVPRDGDGDLPGRTLQLRTGTETEYVDNAVLIEAQDNDP
ncbi:hypothetical protein [Haloplanus halophilus]|uniref:hypothetical protein n=1 Tax=Haloplanus halophilus TaxID=2949993 RepID=UPI0020400DC5|nr:hypothetical protein [Haloplanus sp. GDY1]